MAKRRFPPLLYNHVSAAGVILAVASTVVLLLLFAIGWTAAHDNPYFGIFLFMVVPPFLILGLALIPLGMLLQWRRARRGDAPEARRWPHVDLAIPSHRNAAVVFLLGTLAFVVISAFGSYNAYHYSESVSFCGTTCHEVMEPEYVTYTNSPHARVACTACHVGPGADWFVRSKLSGAYQIYATLADRHPRPIPTPIESLRPAQVTCEQCHWPERAFGAQQRELHHFLYDDESSHWPIEMLIKTGGGDPATGQTSGIHWHMNIGVEVHYIARDERRLDIPWVQVYDRRTGRTTVYQSQQAPLSAEEIARATPRLMDCMDCHNRPTHIFRSPDRAIDEALLMREIDGSIPAIKRVAVALLAGDYASVDEAHRQIAEGIEQVYQNEHPEFYAAHQQTIQHAVAAVQRAYSRNFFPTMRASWAVYPSHAGHMESIGCMRCHGGDHASEEGEVVTTSCTACHTILTQGTGEMRQVASSPDGLEFLHPEDIGDAWQDMGCWECHSGTRP
jgi:hypothetical protein